MLRHSHCEGRWSKTGGEPINKEVKTEETLLKSKELRKSLTPEEAVLWTQLKSHKLNGSKWRKQHPIEPYILDFYCASAKIVIELDGSQHYEEKGLESDCKRDAYLKESGITVLRYSNLDIHKNFEGVCEDILKHINTSSVS